MEKIQSDIEIARKMINLHQSATSRGLEFDLSFETVKQLLSHTVCFYTGQKFEEVGKFSMSVDRLDPTKGYVEGNVVACTVDINSKKANLTVLEISQLYDKLKHYLLIQEVTQKKPRPIHKYSKYNKNAVKKIDQRRPKEADDCDTLVQGC